MLIPQFSIRWLLGVTALCAVAFSIVALAVRGQQWAIGVSAALLALVVLALVHAGLFCLVWVFAGLIGRSGKQGEPVSSPFAAPAALAGPRLSEAESSASPTLFE